MSESFVRACSGAIVFRRICRNRAARGLIFADIKLGTQNVIRWTSESSLQNLHQEKELKYGNGSFRLYEGEEYGEGISPGGKAASADAGRGGGPAAHHREGQAALPRDQGGQAGKCYFLRPARNRKNNTCPRDCQYDLSAVLPDQRNVCRKEGHGGGHLEGEDKSWRIWEKDHSVYR